MPRYTVENTVTEVRTEHHGRRAAFRAAQKYRHVPDHVVIYERDGKGGSRVYDIDGNIIERG